MPPLGESKSMSWELCDHLITGGGSGAYRTKQVRFIVDPMLMNRSGPPRISVMGSEIQSNRLQFNVVYIALIYIPPLIPECLE